jgi:hypothetical protein
VKATQANVTLPVGFSKATRSVDRSIDLTSAFKEHCNPSPPHRNPIQTARRVGWTSVVYRVILEPTNPNEHFRRPCRHRRNLRTTAPRQRARGLGKTAKKANEIRLRPILRPLDVEGINIQHRDARPWGHRVGSNMYCSGPWR